MVWNQNGLTTVTWTIKTSRSKSENWEIADYKLVIIEDRFLIKKKNGCHIQQYFMNSKLGL